MQGKSDPNAELLDAAALCRGLVAEGSVEAFLADHRGELFPDEMFADLFPSGRGRPSVPADVVATVMVLQALEGLVGSGRGAGVARPDQLEGGGGSGARRRPGSTTRCSPIGAPGCAQRAPGADLRRGPRGDRLRPGC